MIQAQLPIFNSGLTLINNLIGYEKRDGRVYYFHGQLPVFSHDEDDHPSFRFITSQLVVGGNVKQVEISRAFGVSAISVKRYVKRLREHGPEGFFAPKRVKSAHVLTGEVLEKVQHFLDEGLEVKKICSQLGLKSNTVNKAINQGRLFRRKAAGDPKADIKKNCTHQK